MECSLCASGCFWSFSNPLICPNSISSWTLEGFLEHTGKMAVGLNFALLSKYIHGCGRILLPRKELCPGRQAGKREEPRAVGQDRVWWRGAQARAHGCCASSRGPGKCQSGKSHGELGLCARPLGTQSSCLAGEPGPRFLWPHLTMCGASSKHPAAGTALVTTCPSVLCALVTGQEGVNCSFTWRHILYFHPWVRMVNVIFSFVTCLSETLNTLRFLGWDLCSTCFTATEQPGLSAS